MTQNRAILFEHSTNLKFRLICYNSVIIRYMLSNCTKLHLVTFPSSIIDLHYMYSRFLTQIHKRQPRVLRRVPPDDNAKLVFDYYDLSLRRERESWSTRVVSWRWWVSCLSPPSSTSLWHVLSLRRQQEARNKRIQSTPFSKRSAQPTQDTLREAAAAVAAAAATPLRHLAPATIVSVRFAAEDEPPYRR